MYAILYFYKVSFRIFIGVHEMSYIANAIEYAAGWKDQVEKTFNHLLNLIFKINQYLKI